jgi:hypothetical protein
VQSSCLHLLSGMLHRELRRFGAEPVEKVIADPQRVSHDGKRWVDCTARREEAGIHHIEVVDLVRLAVAVEHGGLRVVAEADCSVLVGNAGQRDSLTNVEVSREQAVMTLN